MERRVDVVSQVAGKFAAGDAPREIRPKTTSSTDMFLDDDDPPCSFCSYWCIFRPGGTQEDSTSQSVRQS
ncbi:MAG TPA: hypothetical protein VGN09_12280 [Vicinamibacteria bacterium]|jgi:hypothetical protein